MNTAEIRRANLRKMMETETATALSKKLGYRFPSYLSQVAGPNPTRDLTEKTARRYEQELGLEPGALDKMPAAAAINTTAPAPAAPAAPTRVDLGDDITALVTDVINLLGTICAEEHVDVPTAKFATLVSMVFADTVEHGGTPREDRVRQVVRLLK